MNLILTAASNYNFRELKPFFATLGSTDFDGTTVLFYNCLKKNTIDALKKYKVTPIPFYNSFPFSEDSDLRKHIKLDRNKDYLTKTLRYVLYRAYLLEYGHCFSHVLLSDARDVAFQKDPFDFDIKDGITTFLEDKSETIKSNFYNSQWIRDGFGEQVLEEIGDNYISCSGVTYGDPKSLIHYIDEMLPLIDKLHGKNCRDQGIHNYLIYTNKLPNIRLIADDEGPVSTISVAKKPDKIMLDKNRRVVNISNEVINVVHQYDRDWKLLWKFSRHGYFVKKWNLIKRVLLKTKMKLLPK